MISDSSLGKVIEIVVFSDSFVDQGMGTNNLPALKRAMGEICQPSAASYLQLHLVSSSCVTLQEGTDLSCLLPSWFFFKGHFEHLQQQQKKFMEKIQQINKEKRKFYNLYFHSQYPRPFLKTLNVSCTCCCFTWLYTVTYIHSLIPLLAALVSSNVF